MQLLLVKHSLPVVQRGVPPETWRLSPDGRERALRLARYIEANGLSVGRFVSSTEPKAIETAELIAKHVRPERRVEVRSGLHEHVLAGEWFEDQESFEDAVGRFFERPDTLVLGKESAAEALARFEAAVAALSGEADESLLIVTHGRVISLFAAPKFERDVFEFWRRLGLPALVMLGLPRLDPVEVVESFAD